MLLDQIRLDRGLDLEPYKRSFLERRLSIRMYARQCPDYVHYAALLRSDPGEYERLLNALRICVTRFFRDESTFDSLRTRILPALLAARAPQRKLRMWCAGGASGEEAYSLAILLGNLLGSSLPAWQVSIESTDIDPRSIERARNGLYGAYSFHELSPTYREMVDRHLSPVGSLPGVHYQVSPALRSMVSFTVLDLTREKCPENLDLLLCRNVLIYFDHLEQERLYQSFHQAVREGGYLVLGKSEILPMNWGRRFIPADSREHIYQRSK
jgi:two-component system, chemotaxis family, CheB/CheR fusion protein